MPARSTIFDYRLNTFDIETIFNFFYWLYTYIHKVIKK